MRFALAIPYAYPCSSAVVSSQKELHLGGKDMLESQNLGKDKCAHGEDGKFYFYFFPV